MEMLTEAQINRARNLLGYVDPADAMLMLAGGGATREQAFLAVKAAMILDDRSSQEGC